MDRIRTLAEELGCDVNRANADGATPVYIAAQKGQVEAIRVLHELGGDVNRAEASGVTPVCIAAYMGRAEAIRVLHELGADYTRVCSVGSASVAMLKCILAALGLVRGGAKAVKQRRLLDEAIKRKTADLDDGGAATTRATATGTASTVNPVAAAAAAATAAGTSAAAAARGTKRKPSGPPDDRERGEVMASPVPAMRVPRAGAQQAHADDVVVQRTETAQQRSAAARRAATVLTHAPTPDSLPRPPVAGVALASPVDLPRPTPQSQRGAGAQARCVKVESDGGWPAEFHSLRLQPFDEEEYELLRARFFTEYEVTSGARESRTRGGTLRTTARVVGTTVAIAEWPRLRRAVEQLHVSGRHEEALRQLRCLRHYMTRVQHATLPRVLRGEDAASGFVHGEVVSLLSDDEDADEGGTEDGSRSALVDVEALQEILLGRVLAAAAEGPRPPAKRIKIEAAKA